MQDPSMHTKSIRMNGNEDFLLVKYTGPEEMEDLGTVCVNLTFWPLDIRRHKATAVRVCNDNAAYSRFEAFTIDEAFEAWERNPKEA